MTEREGRLRSMTPRSWRAALAGLAALALGTGSGGNPGGASARREIRQLHANAISISQDA